VKNRPLVMSPAPRLPTSPCGGSGWRDAIMGSVLGMSEREDEWVTIQAAARLLSTHPSNVPKLTRRGLLHPRRERPSLARSEVLALRDARA
jgi:hypothetical protein